MTKLIARGLQSTLPLWSMPLIWWFALQAWPPLSWAGVFLINIELAFVLLGIWCVIVLVASSVSLIVQIMRRREWNQSLLRMLFAAVFLASFVGGAYGSRRFVWRWGIESVTIRAEPLVAAIDQFIADHDRPPVSLDELTPRYLERIPTTGIGAWPNFRYWSGDSAKRFDNNPWILSAIPPCHVMGFDNLMYFPLQNYPDRGYGGSLERINDWAYVHE